MFNLDEASGEEFENKVYLENIVLGCGQRQLYMYERSVVMGPIPFWKITLLEVLFSGYDAQNVYGSCLCVSLARWKHTDNIH